MDFDVAIIGGGPAGSLCAAITRRQNPERSVLVLEREHFPRHHVGEVTLPGWAAVLRRAGVLEKADALIPIKKIGVVFNWGPAEAGETWTADFREEKNGRPADGSWHVERGSFDQILLEHAGSLGADVRLPAQVTAVRALPGKDAGYELSWLADGKQESARSRFVVDATGQSRFLARHWNIPLQRNDDMNNYAVYGYWSGSGVHQTDWPPRGNERWAVIASSSYGWVWHIPIGLDMVSVGLVTDKQTIQAAGKKELASLYREALSSAKDIETLLARATLVGSVPDGSAPGALQVVSDWSYASESASGPGWFLTGDTAMFVDPILSSGLTLASQGALMVANALTTLWQDPDVDAELLARSYQRRYRSLGDIYHRMARVWYKRNVRAETWHWQALRERLRTAGGESVYERASDAFTAVCLGAVADPLANAVRAQATARQATEFFTWLSSRRLFEGEADQRWQKVLNADGARAEAKRSLRDRWSKLLRSKIKIRGGAPVLREGYHTSEQSERWQRIQYLELDVPEPNGEHLTLAFPTFADRPEGIFPLLDGTRDTGDAVDELVGGFAVGSDERARRSIALVESLVQLDMLELVEVISTREPPQLTDHPFLTILLESVLAAAGEPSRVIAEMDWLGDQCLVTIESGGQTRRFGFVDAARAERSRYSLFSETTGVSVLDRGDAWTERFVRRSIARVRYHEAGAHADQAAELWKRCRVLGATEIAARRSVGRTVALEMPET